MNPMAKKPEAPLPCPSCASTNVGFLHHIGTVQVICDDCGRRGPHRVKKEYAVEAWNRRRRKK